jgi:YidC/Oxa1 family membrane protein insertase
MISFFKTVAYEPLYNILILILKIPFVDAGMGVILLTILTKILLYPISKKTSIAQIKMKRGEEELSEIKKKYTNKEEQALKVMEFYKNNDINPFISIVTIFVQIPIVYSLYHIFFRAGLPIVNTELLYSFITAPTNISMSLFGIFDISQKSIVFSLIASITTFIQMQIQQGVSGDKKEQDSNDFSKVLGRQMKYTMPIVVFFISWKISAAVSLYWIVSNICSSIQDYYLKKTLSSSV